MGVIQLRGNSIECSICIHLHGKGQDELYSSTIEWKNEAHLDMGKVTEWRQNSNVKSVG